MTQPQMHQRMQRFFSPSITLVWRGHFGNESPHWHPETTHDAQLLRQFMDEAGFKHQPCYLSDDQYDAVLKAASNHNYSIETIGDHELEQS